jgi:hypothetical protein
MENFVEMLAQFGDQGVGIRNTLQANEPGKGYGSFFRLTIHFEEWKRLLGLHQNLDG